LAFPLLRFQGFASSHLRSSAKSADQLRSFHHKDTKAQGGDRADCRQRIAFVSKIPKFAHGVNTSGFGLFFETAGQRISRIAFSELQIAGSNPNNWGIPPPSTGLPRSMDSTRLRE
jgi:hypothetical protein